MPILQTMTTGWRVAPFLARTRRPAGWVPDPSEVVEILEPRIRDLADPARRGVAVEDMRPYASPQETPHVRLGPYRIWGMTYRILEPLLPRILAGEWPL
ncbi:MAG: hypothetical protein R3B81_04670 [bacterium]